MSIEAIAPLQMPAIASEVSGVTAAKVDPMGHGATLFEGMLDSATSLNKQMQANDQSLQALALGDTDNLHRVMMNLESTKLSFDLMLQVRNKLLDAYQELMRLQV